MTFVNDDVLPEPALQELAVAHDDLIRRNDDRHDLGHVAVGQLDFGTAKVAAQLLPVGTRTMVQADWHLTKHRGQDEEDKTAYSTGENME